MSVSLFIILCVPVRVLTLLSLSIFGTLSLVQLWKLMGMPDCYSNLAEWFWLLKPWSINMLFPVVRSNEMKLKAAIQEKSVCAGRRSSRERRKAERMKSRWSLRVAHSKETRHDSYLLSLPDYPHKYGSEGGCADHSVFERMRKYQASAVEQPVNVRTCIPAKPFTDYQYRQDSQCLQWNIEPLTQ